MNIPSGFSTLAISHIMRCKLRIYLRVSQLKTIPKYLPLNDICLPEASRYKIPRLFGSELFEVYLVVYFEVIICFQF